MKDNSWSLEFEVGKPYDTTLIKLQTETAIKSQNCPPILSSN